jgi:hypothetical protein
MSCSATLQAENEADHTISRRRGNGGGEVGLLPVKRFAVPLYIIKEAALNGGFLYSKLV